MNIYRASVYLHRQGGVAQMTMILVMVMVALEHRLLLWSTVVTVVVVVSWLLPR